MRDETIIFSGPWDYEVGSGFHNRHADHNNHAPAQDRWNLEFRPSVNFVTKKSGNVDMND